MMGLLLFAMSAPILSCLPVERPNIFAEDLAKALPGFTSIPGDVVVGVSPPAGVQKHFNSVELNRIGSTYGITVPSDAQLCFEWPNQPLTQSAVITSMEDSL